MKTLATQLKWEFKLLQKNNIISISFAVTAIYGVLLFFLRDIEVLDKVLVSMVLNDPTVIGYFFIALAVYAEMKHKILQAIFTSPLNLHTYLIAKTIALTIIGTLCSIGLAVSVRGMDFDLVSYVFGSFGICLLSTFLGIYVLTFTNEFLKFAMLSFPVFLTFANVPLLQYLGVIDMGWFSYAFPIQGSIDLIDFSVSGKEIQHVLAYASTIFWIPIFYWMAYKRFSANVVYK